MAGWAQWRAQLHRLLFCDFWATGCALAEPLHLLLLQAPPTCPLFLACIGLQAAHRHEPIDLLVAPFCAMASSPDHPTFKWPADRAERFAAAAAGVARLHAVKLRAPVVAAHHCGPWASPLPALLPPLPPDPVPLSGAMLGATAAYAAGGGVLARVGTEAEGMLMVELPLLQHPRAQPGAQGHIDAGVCVCSAMLRLWVLEGAEPSFPSDRSRSPVYMATKLTPVSPALPCPRCSPGSSCGRRGCGVSGCRPGGTLCPLPWRLHN